ncbi:hypothetical protein E3E12_02115 [Formicincola oecophyllae]|uniref:Uncharacterized protein n=1 Tax=Formicincola oecophyllae TaxID=2558361 RepID=A0A4Y6U883_9PROT|nr:hypothetical protein [Formicincola oecophyllae]QDH13190.1 hypothetical protein E3E12_02115 [Formicincola oecophyllae]
MTDHPTPLALLRNGQGQAFLQVTSPPGAVKPLAVRLSASDVQALLQNDDNTVAGTAPLPDGACGKVQVEYRHGYLKLWVQSALQRGVLEDYAVRFPVSRAALDETLRKLNLMGQN